MLPSVRNRFISAYQRASKPIPQGAFVRVWNQFYLCDPKLSSAIRSYSALASPLSCGTEKATPPIVWFAWGGAQTTLDGMKKRFYGISPEHPFFYDKNTKAVTPATPQPTDFPKHPQGLLEEPIVHYLAKIL